MENNQKFTDLIPRAFLLSRKQYRKVFSAERFQLHAADPYLIKRFNKLLHSILSSRLDSKGALLRPENVLHPRHEYAVKLNYLYILEARIQIISVQPHDVLH